LSCRPHARNEARPHATIGQPRFFLDDEAPRAAHELGREQAATPAPPAIACADGHPAQST